MPTPHIFSLPWLVASLRYRLAGVPVAVETWHSSVDPHLISVALHPKGSETIVCQIRDTDEPDQMADLAHDLWLQTDVGKQYMLVVGSSEIYD